MEKYVILLIAITLPVLFLWTLGKFRKQGRRIMALEDKITRLEETAEEVVRDVPIIRGVIETAKASIVELNAIIVELRGQIDTTVFEARIDAVTTKLAGADAELDTVTQPPTEPPV